MMTESYDVTFRPPAMANRYLPIQLTGSGQLTLREDGFDVTGSKVASKGRNALAVLGFFAIYVLVVIVGIKTGIDVEILVGVGIALGGLIYGIFNKMPVKEGEVVTYNYTWANVSKIVRESGMLIIVMKKSKPKGAFYLDYVSDLERELKKHSGK